MTQKILIDRDISLIELDELAKQLRLELLKKTPFCLLLTGELGAGKSTFSRALFYSLGLDQRMHVTSPTFSLVNEYEIKGDYFAHLDLYRIANGDLDESWFTVRDYRGFLIEWGDKFIKELPVPATHRLSIDFKGEGRRYVLEAL